MRRRLLVLGALTVVAVVGTAMAAGDSATPRRTGSTAGRTPGTPGDVDDSDESVDSSRTDTTMELVGQTPWVGLGGEFVLRLKVGGPRGIDGLDVAVSVFPPVATRSEFAQTLTDRVATSALSTTEPVPAVTLSPEPGGVVTLRLGVQDPEQPPDPLRLPLNRRDGVHPVRVDLRYEGDRVQRITTHLVYLPEVHTGAKLGASLVVPLDDASASEGRSGGGPADSLAAAAEALEAARSIPVAVAPTPGSLVSAVDGAAERRDAVTASLRRAVAGRQVLTATYVPVSLPSLLGAGLFEEADRQFDRGTSATADVLGVEPDGRTWMADDNLDPASLDLLRRRGVEHLISSESGLVPIPDQKLTLTHPFALDGQQRDRSLQGVVADAGLADHFTTGDAPVLSAHRLLADLAVLYLDRPGDVRRGVAVVAPRSWRPDRVFLETFATGLSGHPLVEGIGVDALFDGVPAATTASGTPLVRRPAAPSTSALAPVAGELRTQRRRLSSLGAIIGPSTAVYGQLEDALLAAQSSATDSAGQRAEAVQRVRQGIDAELREIEVPDRRSITITARKADVPITFRNRTNNTARVRVRVQSDKLEFPGGASRVVELTRANTTERFLVEARTSGAFPLTVTLESPDGDLVISESRLTVRSTAASRASLALSLGALAFLAVWWGRHALRGRRAGRLVPA